MNSVPTKSVCLVFGLLMTSLANAHQFWIHPSSYTARSGEQIGVFLKTGHGDQLESFPRNAQHFTRFVMVGPEGERVVPGQEGVDPAGWAKPTQPGLHALAYQSVATRSEMEPERFEAYLREESLDQVISQRAKRGESAKPGISTYVRCAKALVNVGKQTSTAQLGNVGMALELNTEKSLNSYRVGEPLALTLTFEGKPVSGVLVAAMDTRDPTHPISARTDQRGKVSLPLSRPGEWLLSAVHMIPARPEAGADWESFRASLSFEIGGPGTR